MHDCMIILTTSTKETYFDTSPNISNGKHLHHGSNSTQIPLYDFVSPNANSSAANMTNTLTFVCHNHIKRQISQNQLIDLQETLKHDSILLYRNKQTRTHKTAITTINKIDHFNNNATFQTTNETRKQPIINHHGNLAKNNLVQTINRTPQTITQPNNTNSYYNPYRPPYQPSDQTQQRRSSYQQQPQQSSYRSVSTT